MMITVTPEAFSQFGPSGESFCLVTDEAYVEGFHIAPGGGYRDYRRLALPAGMDLPEMLNRQVPEDAHVLVVCPDRFLSSPSAEEISGRRLAIMPAGSTPLTWEQVRYFLTVAERNDAAGHAKAADAFFDAVEQCPSLRIVDAAQGTEAVFDHLAGDYAWNQQAGELAPGEQQILPAGELSVLPVDITGFDPDARLALNGSLTLRGWPIVHRYDAPEDLADQRRLFGELSGLASHSLVLHVVDGVIERVDARDEGGRAVAASFEELFDTDPRYRTVWEIGFGVNTDMQVLPANCGPNEVYGATGGALHLGLGLTPSTRFALTFSCPRSSVTTPAGEVILGARLPAPEAGTGPRLVRTAKASCGCH